MILGARTVGSTCARLLGAVAALVLLARCGDEVEQREEALTSTFLAVADGVADASAPGTNFAGQTRLMSDGAPERHVYLAFEVKLDRPVQSARLQLYAVDPCLDGPELYVTGPLGIAWTESGLTWDNRPVPEGRPLGDLAEVVDRTWVEFDVTSVVQASGTYSFVLVSSAGDGVDFASREWGTGSRAPRLVVTVQEPPAEPPPGG